MSFSTKVQEIISTIIAHKEVSISKLVYLNLRKKLLFVSVLPIEKVRSHHMTLDIGNIYGFHEFCALFFAGKQI